MKEQLLSILNENSAELTVEKAEAIAHCCLVNWKQPLAEIPRLELLELKSTILESFESFKKIRLEKGQFAPNAQKPKATKGLVKRHELQAYESARAERIFKGFSHTAEYYAESDSIGIDFASDDEDNTMIDVFGSDQLECEIELPCKPTIGDLLHEVEVYNRTAKEPINLKFTENILPLLGVKI